LVSDGEDNVLVAITGQNGDGIAVVDLSSLPEPLPLPYSAAVRSGLSRMQRVKPNEINRHSPAQAARAGQTPAVRLPRRIPHRMKVFTTLPRIR
jgi:hypothetical protein